MLLASSTMAKTEPDMVEVPPDSFVVVDGVNVRNGNFSISYKLSDYSKWLQDFTITYNNKETETFGMFGRGWGSVLDTRLVYMPDGIAAVRENGTGSVTVYGKADPRLLEQEIADIVRVATARDPAISAETLRSQLADRGVLFNAVLKYGLEREFPRNTRLALDMSTTFTDSGECGGLLERDWSGYVRRYSCDTLSIFRPDGLLQVSFDAVSGVRQEYSYEYGKLTQIDFRTLSGETGTVKFTWTGAVIGGIRDENGKVKTFTHDDRSNLIFLGDPQKANYRYTYDARDNMIDIEYIDQSHNRMTYDNHSATTSVTTRNGVETTFTYQQGAQNSDVWTTRVTRKTEAGESVKVYKLGAKRRG